MIILKTYSLKYEVLVDRFTNNVLSTAQQVWLRKLGGAKPVVNENASGIISAGKAKRSASQPAQIDDRLVLFGWVVQYSISFDWYPNILLTFENRLRPSKEEARRKQISKALPDDQASVSDTETGSDDESKETVSN